MPVKVTIFRTIYTAFMISVSLYKQKHGMNPSLDAPRPEATDAGKKKAESGTQTDFEVFCAKCTQDYTKKASGNDSS